MERASESSGRAGWKHARLPDPDDGGKADRRRARNDNPAPVNLRGLGIKELSQHLLEATIAKGPSITWLCESDAFFKPHFKSLTSWFPWLVFLKCLFGLPLLESERLFAHKLTGRTEFPEKQFSEAWVIAGRRGGKSIILALIAVFFAVFRDYRPILKPGERATIMIIAADRDQARIIFRYALALIVETPILKHLLTGQTKEKLELSNRVNIEIHTTSFRSVRGYTIPVALLDETAFWRDETASNPDIEVLKALSPGMATVPNPMVIGASSPYWRKGLLYQKYKDHYSTNDPNVLVWQAPTAVMNPTISAKFLEDEYAKDPSAAAAEYGAQFRTDIEAFIPKELIERYTVKERKFLNPVPGRVYHAWIDPSGGAQDSFTLGIAHEEEDRAVLDFIMERVPPFNPDSVVAECASIMNRYGLSSGTGDLYAGDWVAQAFRKCNISYIHAKMDKSELYSAFLPMLTAGKTELLDNPKLHAQLGSLERRLHAGGKEVIDHPPRSHDDVANVAAGACVLALPMRERWSAADMAVSEPLITVHHHDHIFGQIDREFPQW